MLQWFGQRSGSDDAEAIVVSFEAALMPEDVYLMDLIPANNAFVGAQPFSTS
jgi:hypothetical protein